MHLPQRWFNIRKSINILQYINRLKENKTCLFQEMSIKALEKLHRSHKKVQLCYHHLVFLWEYQSMKGKKKKKCTLKRKEWFEDEIYIAGKFQEIHIKL